MLYAFLYIHFSPHTYLFFVFRYQSLISFSSGLIVLIHMLFPPSCSSSCTVPTGLMLNTILLHDLSHGNFSACSLTTGLVVGDLTQELIDSLAPLFARLHQRGSCGLVLRRTGWTCSSTEHSEQLFSQSMRFEYKAACAISVKVIGQLISRDRA